MQQFTQDEKDTKLAAQIRTSIRLMDPEANVPGAVPFTLDSLVDAMINHKRLLDQGIDILSIEL